MRKKMRVSRLPLPGKRWSLPAKQRSFLPTPFIAALPTSVKLLAQTGRNVPHIDTATCTARGIIVSASGGGNSIPTVELTWAVILASVRNLGIEINNFADAFDINFLGKNFIFGEIFYIKSTVKNS